VYKTLRTGTYYPLPRLMEYWSCT